MKTISGGNVGKLQSKTISPNKMEPQYKWLFIYDYPAAVYHLSLHFMNAPQYGINNMNLSHIPTVLVSFKILQKQ